jgi:hypothetical protein
MFTHSASPVRPTSQIFTAVIRLSPVMTRSPSGENATDTTPAVPGADSVSSSCVPVSEISHSLAVPSSLPVTSRVELGLQSAHKTAALWPWSVKRTSPVSASQMRAVRSTLDVASHLPSGLQATL